MKIFIRDLICRNMAIYMKDRLDKILNEYGYNGLIFKCQSNLYPRYHDKEFKDILLSICYNSISETISEDEKMSECLMKRVKEQLPDKIEHKSTKRAKGNISIPSIGSVEGEKGDDTNIIFPRPETLIGLLEGIC